MAQGTRERKLTNVTFQRDIDSLYFYYIHSHLLSLQNVFDASRVAGKFRDCEFSAERIPERSRSHDRHGRHYIGIGSKW